MENKRISILVPVYKVETFIAKCAKSLFEQDYDNIQFVFVDDCTPDKSIEVLKEVIASYPNKSRDITILHHERNKGLSAARNTALDAADGEYIMPIDSDDFLSSDSAVSHIMLQAEENDADAFIFDMQDVYPNKQVAHSQDIPSDPKEYTLKLLRREVSVCLCGGVYKRDLFVKHGIRSIEGVGMGEDYAVKPRLMYYAKKVVHLPEPYYCYTHISESSYTKNFTCKHVEDMKLVLAELNHFFSRQQDAKVFLPALQIAFMRVRAELAIGWGIAGKSTADFKAIDSIQSPYEYFSTDLSPKYKISLLLLKYKLPFLLKAYSKAGIWVKQILK